MKKVSRFLLLTVPLILLSITVSLIFTRSANGEVGGGNLVTCYSTFTVYGDYRDKWDAYDCGNCSKKRCAAYSDSGSCNTKGGAVID
jgi:hypothetical protein